jgi:2-oxo-3-hexenedioate decarboxylase
MMPDRGSRSSIDPKAIATELIAILGTGHQIPSFSAQYPDLELDDAYQVADIVRRLRESRGERVAGRKIGFTNRAAWASFSVTAPIWGYMYDHTIRDLPDGNSTFPLNGLSEPRIEPELILELASPPMPGMDEWALLGCIAWVAHGFEIVQSVYPGWTFTAADAVAAFGVHGALLIGTRHDIAGNRERWLEPLSSFKVDLGRNGESMAHGHARDVLGGPLTALRYLVDLLANDEISPPLAAGEIITTGTITRAFPVTIGETWTTKLDGAALEGVRVRLV